MFPFYKNLERGHKIFAFHWSAATVRAFVYISLVLKKIPTELVYVLSHFHLQSKNHLLSMLTEKLIELHQSSIYCDETVFGVGGN